MPSTRRSDETAEPLRWRPARTIGRHDECPRACCGRWRGHASPGADPGRQQAPAAGGALADDLLPAPAAAARRDPRGADRDRPGPRRSAHRPARRRQDGRAGGRHSRSSSSTSPTRCRRSPAGSRRSSAWPRASPAGDKLVVCLGDNLFEYAQTEELREFADGDAGAPSSSRRCPTPSASASSSTARTTVSWTWSRRRGVVDTRYPCRRRSDAVVGLYCYDAGRIRHHPHLEPSSRGELEITDVNRSTRSQGRLEARRIRGWWHDAGTHEALASWPRSSSARARTRRHDRRPAGTAAPALRGRARLVLRAPA